MKFKPFHYGVATMIGTTIGVGIFGVPYVFSKAGLVAGLIFLLLVGIALTVINLIYGEVVLRVRGHKRLVGITKDNFGKKGKAISSVIVIMSFWGSLLAYIIVGGDFLDIILGPWFGGDPFIYSILFFAIGTLAIFIGLKVIAKIEIVMTSLLFIAVAIIFIVSLPHIKLENYLVGNISNWFLPYGVIFFALGSSSAIPELEDILGWKHKKDLKKVIIWGGVISILITLLFSLSVLGVSGLNTSDEAIRGLSPYLGDTITLIGAVFGFLALITSFLVIGINLDELFRYDYKMKLYNALFFALGIPFLLFLFASQNFIKVISITGGVLGGLTGILIILNFLKLKSSLRKPEYEVVLNRFWIVILALLFVAGISFEIWSLVK